MKYRQEIIAEINLANLRHNLRQFKHYIQPAQIIAVVKANAYGHGALQVAKICIEEGVTLLAVATVDEAVELRDAGIETNIMIFGKIWENQINALYDYNFQPVIASEEDYQLLASAAESRLENLSVHMEIDTGMGRVGILPEHAVDIAEQIQTSEYLKMVGVMSHFATADVIGDKLATLQHQRFSKLREEIIQIYEEQDLPEFHLANSAGTLNLEGVHYDRVRLGLSMYGIPPSGQYELPIDIKPLMKMKSKVGYVRNLPAGWTVGYGATYQVQEESTICFCPGGYEDGIPRRYGNNGEVLIHGKRFPVVGNVSMDSFLVDVKNEPVQTGDKVVILGSQEGQEITAWEISNKLGVIPYEVVCGISPRVPRIYIDN